MKEVILEIFDDKLSSDTYIDGYEDAISEIIKRNQK
jgi:hypothetical protein